MVLQKENDNSVESKLKVMEYCDLNNRGSKEQSRTNSTRYKKIRKSVQKLRNKVNEHKD